MKIFILLAMFLSCAGTYAGAYEHRDFLMKEYEAVGHVFARGRLPYPSYDDRAAWEAVLGDRAGTLVKGGEKYLDFHWQHVPMSAYLEYERTGNRNIMQNPYEANRKALNALLMAELAEGKGRFTGPLADGLWFSCQMPSWVLSAHQVRQSTKRALPDPRENLIDLASAGYGATVAFAWHFLHDSFEALDPSLNWCIENAVREKILDPYLDENEFSAHWWLAENWKPGNIINNWNPWCNSNVLLCFLLMESDEDRFRQAVEQSLRSTDRFINYVKGDGACEEGPAYWGHAAGKLYDYLRILYYASNGKFSVFDNPQIRAMGEYIAASCIGDGYYVNFADASARLRPDAGLIYRYGRDTGSGMMQDFAMYRLGNPEQNRFSGPGIYVGNDTFRSLEDALSYSEMSARAALLNRRADEVSFARVYDSLCVRGNVWYPETEFAYFTNDADWFFAAKGGFNNESHNHNDAGTFILYIDGVPVFVDAGVGTYTKQTFSESRYDIWSMQSDWHNLPLINGTSQIYGAGFKATGVTCDTENMVFSAEIASAYSEAAACRSWKRAYRLKRDALEITDRYALERRILPDTLNFLVRGAVYLPGETLRNGKTVSKGCVVIENGDVAVKMTFPACLTPSVEVKILDDPRLSGIWGDSLRRISFASAADAPVRGTLKFVIEKQR